MVATVPEKELSPEKKQFNEELTAKLSVLEQERKEQDR